ncbi:Mnd1, meiotic nuclear division protein 1 [Blastocystis sp. ATCC 50177/Nand II]|uniref:Mnd1, meiotic nuclear division protein 1 n=1 Tax=Blastocystis sp. subtype 1 (strain ATCC 50177 / NandII) TaxID=478820 RepID=A0A196SPT6_BLAHN|nr:Mnd1, meiotic nuclear division protein 1 [Blastocystis sp. ATCC 50177/Nand II]
MAKKRGLSADEKKQKMRDAMLAGKSVYNMKELEKIGKEQGISGMVIKDVVQEMLDDDMIIQEKVGSNSLFWIFPSQSYVLKKRKLDTLRQSVGSAREEKEKLEAEIAKAKVDKPDSEHRSELLKQYEALKSEKEGLLSTLDTLKEHDPETIRQMKEDIKTAVDGANRWTDNIWSMKSFLTRKQGISSKEADQALEIPDDFDYVELPPCVK